MKKQVLKYAPKAILAIILLYVAGFLKFVEPTNFAAIFTEIKFFGLDEHIARMAIGVIEILIAVGIFIPATKNYASFGGIIVSLGAIYYHIGEIGFEGPNLIVGLLSFVTLALSVMVLKQKPEQKITLIAA